MRIVVLVKDVPDTYSTRALNLETGLAERTDADHVFDEICERALEVALSYADTADGTHIHVVTVGPEHASTSIRKALAMGADAATHVIDDELRGADLLLTARTLAAVVKRSDTDLVLAGNASTDGAGGALPAALAELLGVPALTALTAVQITENSVSGTRQTETELQEVTSPLPAVVSVTEALPEGRFPHFKGIVAAKKKPLETVTLSELGITADPNDHPSSIMLTISERPARSAGTKIVDTGDAGEQLAAYLTKNRLV